MGAQQGSLFEITGGGQCLRLLGRDGTVPEIVFFGPAANVSGTEAAASAHRPIPHGGLDGGEVLDCFPEAGRGFNGHPAIVCHRDDRRFVSQLRVTSCAGEADAARVDLADEKFGLSVTIDYHLDETGVLEIATQIVNSGRDRLALNWAAAAVLPSQHDEILLFDGRWAREFQQVRTRLQTGLLTKENRTGRTSHHAPPFLVAGTRHFGETDGEVLLVHLAWSGNHRMLAERLRDGRIQLQCGELFLPGEMILEPGETYACPKVYLAHSRAGLNGLSAQLHRFVRTRILAGRLSAKPRPVHFNSWEAVYFEQNLATMKALADSAANLGVERFIVDDGWFKGRSDDKRALGDWTTDRHKYPDGLGPLVEHVNRLGMEFGLWVEPEMANADSDLLRAHPDWILGVEGLEQPLGRNQFVLDLTREEVANAIFGRLDALLAAHAIAYLKWDMNRDLSHPASRGRPAVHAQTKAVYTLIDRLRRAHPDVEIESCSSGGGRADYEILKRSDRIWTSDCNDPIERQAIQRGFSILFPPEVMGAHVGPRRSHTTARSASLQLRALTALFGHMGIEGDVREFSERERGELAHWIAFYKQLRPLLHGGTLHRLESADVGLLAFMVENGEALVSAAQIETPPYAAPQPLRLSGLDPSRSYDVRLVNPPAHPERAMKRASAAARGEVVRMAGADLVHSGLPLPILRAGEIAVFHLEPVT